MSRSPSPEPATETLRRFAAHAERLTQFAIVREDDLRASFSIQGGAIGDPVQLSHHEPDEEHLRSYLLDFRKFVLKGEPVYVDFVLNVARRHITSDHLVALIDQSRTAWQNSRNRGGIKFVVNGEDISPAEITDLWIHGFYFHDDPAKRERLDALARTALTRYLFLNAIVDASRVVLQLGRICAAALREGLVAD